MPPRSPVAVPAPLRRTTPIRQPGSTIRDPPRQFGVRGRRPGRRRACGVRRATCASSAPHPASGALRPAFRVQGSGSGVQRPSSQAAIQRPRVRRPGSEVWRPAPSAQHPAPQGPGCGVPHPKPSVQRPAVRGPESGGPCGASLIQRPPSASGVLVRVLVAARGVRRPAPKVRRPVRGPSPASTIRVRASSPPPGLTESTRPSISAQWSLYGAHLELLIRSAHGEHRPQGVRTRPIPGPVSLRSRRARSFRCSIQPQSSAVLTEGSARLSIATIASTRASGSP